jgi:hypothetical protein
VHDEQAIPHWIRDFALCAQRSSVEPLEDVLPPDPGETPAAHTQRIHRVYRAYRYASANADAFAVLGEYERDPFGRGALSLRVVFALYVLFNLEAYDDKDPPLESVIDIVVAALDSSADRPHGW